MCKLLVASHGAVPLSYPSTQPAFATAQQPDRRRKASGIVDPEIYPKVRREEAPRIGQRQEDSGHSSESISPQTDTSRGNTLQICSISKSMCGAVLS